MVRARIGRYWECANVLIASFRSHSASVRKNKRACSPLILNAEFVNVLVLMWECYGVSGWGTWSGVSGLWSDWMSLRR